MRRMAVIITICIGLGSCSSFEALNSGEISSVREPNENLESVSNLPLDGIRASAPPKAMRESIYRSKIFSNLRSIEAAATIVTLQFKQVPLPVFASALSRLSGLNIAVAKNMQSRLITVYLNRLSLHEALQAVAYTHRLKIDIEDNVVFIGGQSADKEKSGGTSLWRSEYTELFYPVHAAPEEIRKILEPLFEGDADKPEFGVDPRTQALIVKGSRESIEWVDALLKHLDLDTPVRQVLIEAFVVEANEDFERSLGARFRLDTRDSDGLRVTGVIDERETEDETEDGNDEQNLAVDLPIPIPALGVGLLIDGSRLKLELTALEAEGKSRIVSNPRIFTLDGQEAVIFQGEEVPYQTVSDSGTRTEFKQAGLRLAVTPIILWNNQLQLNITVNKDTVDTRTRNPPITRREVSTRLKVADGAIAVIGGIYLNARVDASRRVPLLGRLPIIGGAFRQTVKDRDTRQLLVFIAPRIVG